MLGVVALFACLAALIAVGRIVYFLYAPPIRDERGVARVPGSLVIEPMFAVRRALVPPRTRMARGTGAVAHAPAARYERTDKVSALPL